MGITFDILSDSLLSEASDFSQFFNSEEPIRLIHKMLKVDANTQLILSPTNNRHVLWDELKRGKAIFTFRRKPDQIEQAIESFKSEINKHRPPPNRTQTYNEVKYLILQHYGKQAIDKKHTFTSKEYQKIQEKINGPIKDALNEMFPKNQFSPILDMFLMAIRPGDSILMKRISHDSGDIDRHYMSPEDRRFPMAKKPDEPGYKAHKPEKIFGQKYIGWFFDGNKLIDKKYYSKNGIKAYRDEIEGWAKVNFYVVEDKSFLKPKTHPFVSTNENQFAMIIPMDQQGVSSFVNTTLKKYERVIADKMKANASNMDPNESDYDEVMKTVSAGIAGVDSKELFKNFILGDITHKLTDYMIVKSDVPKDPNMPWDKDITQRGNLTTPSKKWKNVDKDEAAEAIQNMMRIELPVRQTEVVSVRLKTDRSKIQKMDLAGLESMSKGPNAADKYEMFDVNKGIWTPIDPNYIKNYKTNMGVVGAYAVAFATPQDATDFSRKFAIYAMRNIVKAPENKQIDDILGML